MNKSIVVTSPVYELSLLTFEPPKELGVTLHKILFFIYCGITGLDNSEFTDVVLGDMNGITSIFSCQAIDYMCWLIFLAQHIVYPFRMTI